MSHPADRHPKEEQRVQQQIQQDEDEAIAIVKPADAQLELKDMTESHLQSQVPIAANILAINPSMMTPVGKSPISHSGTLLFYDYHYRLTTTSCRCHRLAVTETPGVHPAVDCLHVCHRSWIDCRKQCWISPKI